MRRRRSASSSSGTSIAKGVIWPAVCVVLLMTISFVVGALFGTRCCRSCGEQVAPPRDELLDGLRWSAGDLLDRVGHTVIPILAMQPGHRGDVLTDVGSEVGVGEHVLGPRVPRD